MNNPQLAYFWPLHHYDRSLRESCLAQLAEAGADNIVLDHLLISEMLARPSEVPRWRKMLVDCGVAFGGAHNPFGPLEDLSCPAPEMVSHMLAMHKCCLRVCAAFGISATTIHIGMPSEYCKDRDRLHQNALRAIEALLPDAEACGVVICIENIWNHCNTAGMLLDAIERFRSPWLGVCWDSGHAQLTRSDTPDIPEQTARASWRDCGYRDSPDEFSDTGDYLRRLLPHIVIAHLHSNDRVRDRHWLPTDSRGLTDWAVEMPVLCSAPRLASLQSESSPSADSPYTMRQQVESLRSIAALGGVRPVRDASAAGKATLP